MSKYNNNNNKKKETRIECSSYLVLCLEEWCSGDFAVQSEGPESDSCLLMLAYNGVWSGERWERENWVGVMMSAHRYPSPRPGEVARVRSKFYLFFCICHDIFFFKDAFYMHHISITHSLTERYLCVSWIIHIDFHMFKQFHITDMQQVWSQCITWICFKMIFAKNLCKIWHVCSLGKLV